MTYSEEDIQAMIEDLKENPDDSTKWHLFGVALLSIGRYDEAENAFRHCMKIDKNNAFALGDLGGLYILKRKPKDAIKYLENSVRLMPENHEYWSALGIAYLQRNKYKDALKAFEKSLSIEPDHLDSIISLGLIYYRMEDWEKAIIHIEKALEKDPENYEALKALARSFMKLHRTKELQRTYQRMLEIDPEDNPLLIYLGQIAFNSGKHEEGIELYKRALEKNPNLIMGWKMLGEALQFLGQRQEAQAALDMHQQLLDKQKRISGLYGH